MVSASYCYANLLFLIVAMVSSTSSNYYVDGFKFPFSFSYYAAFPFVVYCENCVINPSDKLCRCPVCQLEHPNGFPNVCLILEHYLEEQFPKLYGERIRASVERSDCQIPSKRMLILPSPYINHTNSVSTPFFLKYRNMILI